jgi:hypothetical protein
MLLQDLPDEGQTRPKHVADDKRTHNVLKVLYVLAINTLIDKHKAMIMPKYITVIANSIT